MANSKYLAAGAVAAAVIATGAFVCAKNLTEYFERRHQRNRLKASSRRFLVTMSGFKAFWTN